MYLLKELHTDIKRLSDLLLWGGMVHGPCPAVLLNKDGTYQATLRYRGQDVTMMAHEQRLVYLHSLNLLLKRLGSGWALLADEWHEETTTYPDSGWTHPAACFVDAARRALFEAGMHFEGQYFLTLCWQPPSSYQQRWYDGFFATRERERQQSDDEKNLAAFVAGLERFADALEPLLPALVWCTPEETITYLHRCVSWDRHPVAVPEVPMYLDALLTTHDFLPGNTPMLGERFVRPIGIKTWPRDLGIHIPAALQGVPFPYRFTVRWLALDKLDARQLLSDYQKKWAMQVKPFWTLILEAISRQQSNKVNQEAVENAASLQRAKASLDLDQVSFGFLTPTVTVWGDTHEELVFQQSSFDKFLVLCSPCDGHPTEENTDGQVGDPPPSRGTSTVAGSRQHRARCGSEVASCTDLAESRDHWRGAPLDRCGECRGLGHQSCYGPSGAPSVRRRGLGDGVSSPAPHRSAGSEIGWRPGSPTDRGRL